MNLTLCEQRGRESARLLVSAQDCQKYTSCKTWQRSRFARQKLTDLKSLSLGSARPRRNKRLNFFRPEQYCVKMQSVTFGSQSVGSQGQKTKNGKLKNKTKQKKNTKWMFQTVKEPLEEGALLGQLYILAANAQFKEYEFPRIYSQ